MGPRQSNRTDDRAEQLSLPAPATSPKTRVRYRPPDLAAKRDIERRSRISVVPGHVRLTFTFDLKRRLAERLSAQAIRENKHVEALIIELLDDACP